MLKKIENTTMSKNNSEWFSRCFHFPYTQTYEHNSGQFGVLRLINDDLIQPRSGFDTHHHRDVEIITYVIDGELIHGDSMGNLCCLTKGHYLHLSAGTGILHCKYNLNSSTLRYLQIGVMTNKKNHAPFYKKVELEWDRRKNNWFLIVSGQQGKAEVTINQDVNIYVIELDNGKEVLFPVSKGRQAYLVQIDGVSQIQKFRLRKQDALISIEENIPMRAISPSHAMIIEMAKSGF